MSEAVLQLSALAGSPLLDSAGERLGRVEDLIVRLDTGDQLPPVTGLKARIGGREMFRARRSDRETGGARGSHLDDEASISRSSSASRRGVVAR